MNRKLLNDAIRRSSSKREALRKKLAICEGEKEALFQKVAKTTRTQIAYWDTVLWALQMAEATLG